MLAIIRHGGRPTWLAVLAGMAIAATLLGPRPVAAAPPGFFYDELGQALGRFQPAHEVPHELLDAAPASSLTHPTPQHLPSSSYSLGLDGWHQPQASDHWQDALVSSGHFQPDAYGQPGPLHHFDAYAELGNHPSLMPHLPASETSSRPHSLEAWNSAAPSSPTHHQQQPDSWRYQDEDVQPSQMAAHPSSPGAGGLQALAAEQESLVLRGIELLDHGPRKSSDKYQVSIAGRELRQWLERVYTLRNELAVYERWHSYRIEVVVDRRLPGNLLRDASLSAKVRGHGSPSPAAFERIFDPLSPFQVGQHQIVAVRHVPGPVGFDPPEVRYTVLAMPLSSWEGSIAMGRVVLTKSDA
ncbi:uncharacterized protein PFL1_05945 [Pseudozyma flocculosa PF-1]|uniref:Uncharacterized protein n=2 Tax=Pseudozyma flocculosa TaxID=84751 RepID=A0A5C3F2Q4_9BASI|nr:uncharacterized protein PFL1_05945 [Pseudozyma flocculosa PF-1]EPQ26624.1 hypothetical protein PFL1_05945 [Pseudozyma flocculosa PF-1]SPO38380.1 uncharacterized protein PSFLO_03857 [Pseudozyma flocculosa]